MEQKLFINSDQLRTFVQDVFVKMGVPVDDAWLVADNLVAADLRGVGSHGVARLSRYVNGIRDGLITPITKVSIAVETPSTATLDAHDGLGQVAAKAGMELAIQKAKHSGAGFVGVKNSNHYGIAAYYAMMALEHDLIGISLTNSAPLVVPTFAREIFVGTNPISIAVPTDHERPYILDMATSTAPRGKVEVCHRENKPMPPGWATDETGRGTDDAGRVLKNLLERKGGGLLPLGGEGELTSGYKGYGLAVAVDIFSAVLSGAAFGPHVDQSYGEHKQPANVGHFFGALDIKGFIDPIVFKKTMDLYILQLRDLPKAGGANRIYIHGEKEYEFTEQYLKTGVPLHSKTIEMLREIANRVNLKTDFLNG
jgi:LDH2 family malate/lactate/ureidoglycolate dehydrogenase